MKKTIAFLLALMMLFALCACGGDSDNSDNKKENESYEPDYGELYYEAEGLKFGIMDFADAVLDSLGEPDGTFESESCAYQGKDYFYYYDGFEVMANEIDGNMRITGITVADDTVQNPQGVKIGMDIEEALSLMGDGYTQSGSVYKYIVGSTLLMIKAGDDNCVSAIEYAVAANQE
ncbi:MAG: hypothetical protein Q4A83_07370 [Bacillota bacterium]|nr:hypothetical protein [Bacillota bacterium]